MPDSAAYLLVIDHSGSMKKPARTGGARTRWEEMQARAVQFVNRLPLESTVWMAVFSDSAEQARTNIDVLNTEADRQRVVKRILEGYGTPSGKTALYDTMALAFEECERLSRAHPNKYVSVLVYTDGDDSRYTTPEARQAQEQKLARRFGQIVKDNENAWCTLVQFTEGLRAPLSENRGAHIGIGQGKVPLAVWANPATLTLPSPHRQSTSQARIVLSGFERSADILSGKKLSLSFVGEGAPRLTAGIEPASIELKPGAYRIKISIHDAANLPGDREYRGHIRLSYPDLDGFEFVGTRSISVVFQKVEPPKITRLLPEKGSVFPAGRPIVFLVETIQDAQVDWEFGDGDVDRGARVEHTYLTEGTRSVRVTVRTGRGDPPTQEKTTIEIIDVQVSVDPLAQMVWQGVPQMLKCTGRGGIQRYEWIVDGRRFEGQGKRGEKLRYTFLRSGQHTVLVRGIHPKTIVESETRTIQVRPKPSVVLVEPQEGVPPIAGVPVTFRAEIAGPIKSIEWVLRAAKDKRDIKRLDRPVVDGQSTFVHTFSDSDANQSFSVSAIAVLEDEFKEAEPPKVEMLVQPQQPERSIQLIKPVQGRSLSFDQETEFVAQVKGPRIDYVAFSVIDVDSGKTLFSKESPVDADDRCSRFTHIFRAPADLVIRVEAHGVVDGTLRNDLMASRDFAVAYPPIVAKIEVDYDGAFNKPVRLHLRQAESLKEIHWDFGDGTRAADDHDPVHVYDRYGEFNVKCHVVGPGGKTKELTAVVHVFAKAPRAVPAPKVGGEPIRRARPGETIELADESTGDVVRREWLVDGEPVSAGQHSIVIDGEGTHRLTLIVYGPPGAGDGRSVRDEATVEVVVAARDVMLFVLGSVLALTVAVFCLRLFSGNQPRQWIVRVNEGEGKPRTVRLYPYWSRLRKVGRIPMKKLFPGTGYSWSGSGASRDECLLVRRGSRAQQGTYRAVVSHPMAAVGGALQLEAVMASKGNVDVWVLRDARGGGPSRKFHVEIEVKTETPWVDTIVRPGLALATAAAIYLLYHLASMG